MKHIQNAHCENPFLVPGKKYNHILVQISKNAYMYNLKSENVQEENI